MGKYSFSKAERLSRKLYIQELFDRGSSFHFGILKVLALPQPTPAQGPHQVFFSVPKRNFRKAVDRNTLKRRLREAYRLQKEVLAGTQILSIAYIYLSKEKLPSPVIHQKVKDSLEKLKQHYAKK